MGLLSFLFGSGKPAESNPSKQVEMPSPWPPAPAPTKKSGRVASRIEKTPQFDKNSEIISAFSIYPHAPGQYGCLNLGNYAVKGRNPDTGRVLTVHIFAKDEADAESVAANTGLLAPYTVKYAGETPPSDAQLNYAHNVITSMPKGLTAADVSALLTRSEEQNTAPTPQWYFDLATARRVQVSYYSVIKTVVYQIFKQCPKDEKPSLFCYAVFCKERGLTFGKTEPMWDAPVFSAFAPSDKQRQYILQYDGSILNPRKNTVAYKAAVNYIQSAIR
jgi:hypothetical protein